MPTHVSPLCVLALLSQKPEVTLIINPYGQELPLQDLTESSLICFTKCSPDSTSLTLPTVDYGTCIAIAMTFLNKLNLLSISLCYLVCQEQLLSLHSLDTVLVGVANHIMWELDAGFANNRTSLSPTTMINLRRKQVTHVRPNWILPWVLWDWAWVCLSVIPAT
jgi:hypothetical protein